MTAKKKVTRRTHHEPSVVYWYWVAFLRYFDLTSNGHPSFSKLICLSLFIVLAVRGDLSLGKVIALLTASFGRSMWLAFVNRNRPPQPTTGEPA